MAKMQRDKGKAGELEFIKLVRHLTGDGVVLERNLGQSRSGGDDLNGHPLFSFEIKRRKSVTDAMVTGWWQQAVDQALTRGKQPVLAWRQDKQCWRVMVHPETAGFKVDDPRGCLTMDIELFCRCLTVPESLEWRGV